MKQATFEELSAKEVINTADCRRLGYISDMCIDLECGRILSFTVKECTGFFAPKGNEICIPWEKHYKNRRRYYFCQRLSCRAAATAAQKAFFRITAKQKRGLLTQSS